MSWNILFAMRLFDVKCQNLQITPTNFGLALKVSEILNFLDFEIQNLSQDHDVQFTQ